MKFSASVLALAAALPAAQAFSNGAGGCAPGQAAVAGLHVSVPGIRSGSLQQAGISVTFDGAADPVASSDGTDIEVSSEDGFRGVLIMSADPAVGITPVDGVQPAAACAGIGATGVTHFEPSVKNSVEAVVDCQAAEGSTVLLGVTVVVSNNQNEGSEFYYSEIPVTCGEAEDKDDKEDTEDTESPGTVAPTETGTVAGTEATTPAGTAVATEAVTEADSTLAPTEPGTEEGTPASTETGTATGTADGTPSGTDEDVMVPPPVVNTTEAPDMGDEEIEGTLAPTDEDTEDMMMGNETDIETPDDEPTLPTLPTLSPGIASANSPEAAAFSNSNVVLSLGATAAAAIFALMA